ncbi:UNVERIFIED_ORG: hypothetical protein J2W74_005223 [Methylorubrum zatmanii]
MGLTRRFFALGRSFEIRARAHGEGQGALWVADVFEGDAQKVRAIPLGVDLGDMSAERRDEVLAGVEGIVESQCRRGVI